MEEKLVVVKGSKIVLTLQNHHTSPHCAISKAKYKNSKTLIVLFFCKNIKYRLNFHLYSTDEKELLFMGD